VLDHKKLEIIGISVDQADNKVLWRNAIQKNKLPWINLLDPGYSLPYYTFAIDTYPASILIDNDRNIIKINPNISEILNTIR
jgi:hypothetical protein